MEVKDEVRNRLGIDPGAPISPVKRFVSQQKLIYWDEGWRWRGVFQLCGQWWLCGQKRRRRKEEFHLGNSKFKQPERHPSTGILLGEPA